MLLLSYDVASTEVTQTKSSLKNLVQYLHRHQFLVWYNECSHFSIDRNRSVTHQLMGCLRTRVWFLIRIFIESGLHLFVAVLFSKSKIFFCCFF